MYDRARIAVLTLLLALAALSPAVARATPPAPKAVPTATGSGGAVATVDPYASRAAVDVLERGGNAVDAAVAAAAVLGVVEPYSCGIGGGGFMVIHPADGGQTVTIDSREAAPAAMRSDSFIDPATGDPYPPSERVTSGLGVGVPGTVRGWELALDRYGTTPLRRLLRPAAKLAKHGFRVDPTFTQQTQANEDRFDDFTSTRALFLPGGEAPAPGTVLKNRDLARVYGRLAEEGADSFYEEDIARAIVNAVRRPPVANADRNVRPGLMVLEDLERYAALLRPPTRVEYRDFEVLGMGPPSSGGSTVGEALNILGFSDLGGLPRERALHQYIEALRLAFADRNAYLGDPAFVRVPLRGLLSLEFADERETKIKNSAASSPVAPGDPWPYEGESGSAATASRAREGRSTTHLSVADRWGNVVAYTFTIEQTGGSGIVVPRHGFLLNNELTDFDPVGPHPNAPAGGKRPRSSMSPTIVLAGGRPLLALGSPGGSTIITTVLQLLLNRLDFAMTLPEAIAAPRLSQRNMPTTLAEPGFFGTPEHALLEGRGHSFERVAEIGAATGVELLPDGRVLAAAEPERRGGGSAMAARVRGRASGHGKAGERRNGGQRGKRARRGR